MESTANKLEIKVPVIKKNVIITKIGNESIVNPSYEDEKEPYIITLNETGTFILNNIDGKKTIEEIITKIVSNYDITEREAKKDLYELIEDLEEGNIIVWKN